MRKKNLKLTSMVWRTRLMTTSPIMQMKRSQSMTSTIERFPELPHHNANSSLSKPVKKWTKLSVLCSSRRSQAGLSDEQLWQELVFMTIIGKHKSCKSKLSKRRCIASLRESWTVLRIQQKKKVTILSKLCRKHTDQTQIEKRMHAIFRITQAQSGLEQAKIW